MRLGEMRRHIWNALHATVPPEIRGLTFVFAVDGQQITVWLCCPRGRSGPCEVFELKHIDTLQWPVRKSCPDGRVFFGTAALIDFAGVQDDLLVRPQAGSLGFRLRGVCVGRHDKATSDFSGRPQTSELKRSQRTRQDRCMPTLANLNYA